MDLESNQTVSQVAAHDQPIKAARFFTAPQTNGEMLVTGSWDNTIKYWDLRTPNPVISVNMNHKVYTLDVQKNVLVVGTADRFINIVDLNMPDKIKKTLQSPLKWQTRVISLFPDAVGFAVGSIEGRCAIQYVEDKDARYKIHSPEHISQDPSLTYQTKYEFLFQMPSRSTRKQHDQCLLRKRDILPPHPRHL